MSKPKKAAPAPTPSENNSSSFDKFKDSINNVVKKLAVEDDWIFNQSVGMQIFGCGYAIYLFKNRCTWFENAQKPKWAIKDDHLPLGVLVAYRSVGLAGILIFNDISSINHKNIIVASYSGSVMLWATLPLSMERAPRPYVPFIHTLLTTVATATVFVPLLLADKQHAAALMIPGIAFAGWVTATSAGIIWNERGSKRPNIRKPSSITMQKLQK